MTKPTFEEVITFEIKRNKKSIEDLKKCVISDLEYGSWNSTIQTLKDIIAYEKAIRVKESAIDTYKQTHEKIEKV